MQEKQKRSIVIASVLKPVDDTRMFEKFAMSLAKTNVWDVHIIGYGKRIPDTKTITFHPLGIFSRVSFTRIFTPWRVLFRLFQIRPDAIIITTHELLWVAEAARMFLGARAYYDIRENYRLNILHTNAFPAILRTLVAGYVRFKEWTFANSISHFILAERCYADEIKFLRKRFTVIENKSICPSPITRKTIRDEIHFLFSGTLDSSTGVFEAIELVKQLRKESTEITLTIIGYAALAEVRRRIHIESQSNAFIKLVGIDSLVPHSEILTAIQQADAGIIYYQSAPHTKNCIPTKLYEYMAHQLPILYDEKATWASQVKSCQGGMAIDFSKPASKLIIQALRSNKFYPSPPQQVTWESEDPKLLRVLE